MSEALIFGLLFALMLTGMPISISLGLTVLTFLFTMTEVPIESVGLKLFSGLDNFGIMAIPFFILAGTFLTRGGVARRMITFTTSLVGHLPGGLGLAGGHQISLDSTVFDIAREAGRLNSPFRWLFIASALTLAAALGCLYAMEERPLRTKHHDRAAPAVEA